MPFSPVAPAGWGWAGVRTGENCAAALLKPSQDKVDTFLTRNSCYFPIKNHKTKILIY